MYGQLLVIATEMPLSAYKDSVKCCSEIKNSKTLKPILVFFLATFTVPKLSHNLQPRRPTQRSSLDDGCQGTHSVLTPYLDVDLLFARERIFPSVRQQFRPERIV